MPLLIEGQVDNRDETINSLRDQNAQLRRQAVQAQLAIEELRKQLSPLYQALQMVFGVLQELEPSDSSSPAQRDPRIKAVWEDWKQRLGGLNAKFIDALLLHGGMTQTQLRIAVGCATRSVTNVVYALNKAGLISKREGKIYLKEL